VAGETINERIQVLLRLAADKERRLLRRERRAEREIARLRVKLAEDEALLENARRRVERRRAEVADAEEALRRRQVERAAGPVYDEEPDPVADAAGQPVA